jgi:hypothetical protein|tara:strand:+ start:150 stop:422 length:273 start_codon:yes stop_codon:yes gene_type:complete
MAISRKRAPVIDDPQLSRIVSKVYDDINEIINAVNQGDTSTQKSTTEGKPGDIKIVKDSSGDYYVEAKTVEGWIQSDGTSASGFKFRERE